MKPSLQCLAWREDESEAGQDLIPAFGIAAIVDLQNPIATDEPIYLCNVFRDLPDEVPSGSLFPLFVAVGPSKIRAFDLFRGYDPSLGPVWVWYDEDYFTAPDPDAEWPRYWRANTDSWGISPMPAGLDGLRSTPIFRRIGKPDTVRKVVLVRLVSEYHAGHNDDFFLTGSAG